MDMDVESLQRTGRRRGTCLEVFLVLSVMFLFAALTVVAVGGAIVVNELRAKLESPRTSPTQFEELIEAAKRTTFKMQNFVYLEANESKVQTSTMPLTPVSYGTGNSVGSNFLFDKNQKWLRAMRKGTYFTYIDLNVTCTEGDSCPTGLLSVSLGQKLTCEVELPANKTRVSKKCWTVTQLEKQKLLTQMTVTGAGLDTWKLEQSGSGVGMFLVD